MNRSILIVEDEPVLASNIRVFFERTGYTVHLATTIEAGGRQLAIARPDLLVLNHQLPDMDGLGLLRTLKVSNPELSVIMISAQATVELAVAAIKLGAVDFLCKPIGLAELRHAVDAVFGTKGAKPPLAYFRRRERARSHLPAASGSFVLSRS